MRFLLATCFFIIMLLACKGPEPRKPIEVKTGSFFQESVERNKALLEKEEAQIKNIIAKDTTHQYQNSASGFWYYYNIENPTQAYTPQTDDQVLFSFDLRTFSNDTLYTSKEKGLISYKVDKEQLFPGLQNAIKLLRINEKATFLFPSSQAYGYVGDGERIGPKTPLISTVELHTIIIEEDSLNSKTE
ncbi:MAG: gliding motility-associated peptidyl-prolyl isomerase GldI [Bacteroidota bacterium]